MLRCPRCKRFIRVTYNMTETIFGDGDDWPIVEKIGGRCERCDLFYVERRGDLFGDPLAQPPPDTVRLP